ncbi:MAG: SDR family NAD(P)-dependent oxidoreductase [Actinomycetota bacterium]|nr:SDR family NAD(P)-dependent oxidoreductase [Actinomycetota bacterium]
MEDLRGRRVVVTGASRGIGSVVAGELARAGAEVVLIARSPEALERVAAGLPGGPHRSLAIDVADEAAWRAHLPAVLGDGPLHGLVTAAGILSPIGPVGTYAIEAFRRTLDVNVVGTLCAVTSCLAALRAEGGSIVTFSGGGATGPFARFDAYAASKAAVVRLTENLALELAPSHVRANAVAPGFVMSEMHEETLAAGPELVGAAYFERTRSALQSGGGDPPELAAELTAYLLSPRSAPITGKLLSARWDPWREPEFQARLASTPDLATLRRIDDQFFAALPGKD